MDAPPHGSLSPAPSAHELLDNKPKWIEAAICWALLELFHLLPIVSCKKKGEKIMLELGHLLPKFSRWTTSKQKPNLYNWLQTLHPPLDKPEVARKHVRHPASNSSKERKPVSLPPAPGGSHPPSPPFFSPVDDASPLGPPTLIRHQLLQLELSRCLKGHPSSTTPADASMQTRNYDQAAPLSLAPRFWTELNDLQTGGFL